jgi:hypothetical protein
MFNPEVALDVAGGTGITVPVITFDILLEKVAGLAGVKVHASP